MVIKDNFTDTTFSYLTPLKNSKGESRRLFDRGINWKDWSLNDFMYYLDRYLNWFCSVEIKNRLGNRSPLVYGRE